MSSKIPFQTKFQIRKGIAKAGQKLTSKVVKIVQPIAYENAKTNCPHCSNNPTIIGVEGEVFCANCNARYFEWNPSSILTTDYKNVVEEEQYRFSVLMFQIAEHLEKGEFHEAELKCGQAFEISETTSQVWIFAAYCTYFNLPKEIILKQKAHKLISYLERADFIESELITTPIRQAIAYHLYHFLMKKVDFIKASHDHDYEKFQSISFYIHCLKFCFAIYEDSFFLKEMVTHFYGQKKLNWFDYKINDLFLNDYEFVSRITGANGFSAVELDKIIRTIQDLEPAYQPPILLGGDFWGKEKLPLSELLTVRKKGKEQAEEAFRIAQIEKEEMRLDLARRKASAKIAEKRNRVFIIAAVVIWILFVIWAIWNYFVPVLLLSILFLSVFKTKYSP